MSKYCSYTKSYCDAIKSENAEIYAGKYVIKLDVDINKESSLCRKYGDYTTYLFGQLTSPLDATDTINQGGHKYFALSPINLSAYQAGNLENFKLPDPDTLDGK